MQQLQKRHSLMDCRMPFQFSLYSHITYITLCSMKKCWPMARSPEEILGHIGPGPRRYKKKKKYKRESGYTIARLLSESKPLSEFLLLFSHLSFLWRHKTWLILRIYHDNPMEPNSDGEKTHRFNVLLKCDVVYHISLHLYWLSTTDHFRLQIQHEKFLQVLIPNYSNTRTKYHLYPRFISINIRTTTTSSSNFLHRTRVRKGP